MKHLLAIFSLVLCLMMPAAPALAAYDPLGGVCGSIKQGDTSSSEPDSTCDGSSGTKATDPNATLRKVTNIIAVIAGVAAVIIIIVSGIQYITSGGNAQQASTARLALIGALLGLIIIVAARSIILLVLSRVK
jgi:hypothetical protein